ncbi:diguanylate cyclase [Marinicella meishanensis]|uniref:diguanylate cyclase n=1 Tax=Marinicella meishanensis TaxID=2873263 RepID=UPI001CBC4467|nr:diguanylate cyclase [Marinicella sp. NBU2979]
MTETDRVRKAAAMPAASRRQRPSWQVWWLLCLTGLLTGCGLDYHSDVKVPLQIEMAWLPAAAQHHDRSLSPSSLDTMSFTAFNADQLLPFSTDRSQVLLKITPLSSPPGVTEYTLSAYPKYLSQVDHFYQTITGERSERHTQFRNRHTDSRHFSSQKFAFSIDDSALENTHYLLIQSENPRYVKVELSDAPSYIQADSQWAQLTTFLYSIMVAMILFNAIFYLYNKDRSYLLYTLYMSTALLALLWQEGKINEYSWFAWELMGPRSGLIYLALADLTANAFFYRFMRLDWRRSWLVKGVLLCVLLRLALVTYALVQYHGMGELNYPSVSAWFNVSILLSSLLVWIIMLRHTLAGQPQVKYLFVAWTVLIAAVSLRIWFSTNPHPDLIWMAHSYEWAVMLEGLILAFAMANRTLKVREQRDQAVSQKNQAERSIQQHEMITQFQREIQELVKNPTLEADEVTEKINIKFHLLINRAFPVKNSLLHVDQTLQGFCTTGLSNQDLALLAFKFNQVFTTNDRNQIRQHVIMSHKQQKMMLLYLPLDPSKYADTRFVFGLKKNMPISAVMIQDLQSFCEDAYAVLMQAKEMHDVALAANLDSMTGCHNSSSVKKIINESLRHASRTTLAYIDLDNLKSINDQHSHAVGDECIIDFVGLLRFHLHEKAKLGRTGGDEFVAIFSDVAFESCEQIMEDFITQLAAEPLSDHDLQATCSVGLAESRLHDTQESLLHKADTAMYQAKQQGRNQVCVYEATMEQPTAQKA